MRILEFDVNAQNLSKTSGCDFSGLVCGSVNFLACKFNFDSNWNGYEKVVEFTTKGETKFYKLDETNMAAIPSVITANPFFKVSIHGINDKQTFETNTVLIRQERSL